MDEEKVYTPVVIPDAPLPGQEGDTTSSTNSAGSEVYGPKTVKDTPMPTKRIAVELLSSALNTKSRKILDQFEFTESGAIQVGKYEQGVSGDIRISPNGVVGRDQAGLVVFALDADGNLVLKGSLQSGSVITGEVIVGNNSVIIDGEGRRIIVNDGTTDRILIGYDPQGF